MSDLFEDPAPDRGSNDPEFTVSEISGAVKRVVEGEFAHVRVRGEVGRVVVARTGHMYFDLKDDRATLAAVSWKGAVARLSVRPEEGMEIVATGRLTTFAGQSKYQMVVDDVAPAGLGALMAMLEKRKAALAAEGLFAAERKRPLPFLPEVIGVVTSPQGAVIRDILHRLRDRFPRRVLIWPVAVQGKDCAPQVAAAIRGFNAIAPGGAVPRPDLIIVARGGGSIEDLWGFNEEIVVRAAAESAIPLISAVGHETDTTLIDFAADRRAPTPTAAAEMAVPVRMDLIAAVEGHGARIAHAMARGLAERRQRLAHAARLLPRGDALLAPPRQRLDIAADRLPRALSGLVLRRQGEFARVAAGFGPLAAGLLTGPRQRLDRWQEALPRALTALVLRRRHGLADVAGRLRPGLIAGLIALRRARVGEWHGRQGPALARLMQGQGRVLAGQAARLDGALARMAAEVERGAVRLAALSARLDGAMVPALGRRRERLAALDRLRQTLGHRETLRRGFTVVRAGGRLVPGLAAAAGHPRLEIEFHDGLLPVRPDPAGLPPQAGEAGTSPGGTAAPQGGGEAPKAPPRRKAAPKDAPSAQEPAASETSAPEPAAPGPGRGRTRARPAGKKPPEQGSLF